MLIKRLLEPNKFDFWVALFWTVILILLCFKAPSVEKRFYFPNADKVAHLFFYLFFVVLWYKHMLYRGLSDRKYKLYLVLTACFLGIAIEFGQTFFTTTRQGDVRDAAANIIGCVLGIMIVGLLYKENDYRKDIDLK